MYEREQTPIDVFIELGWRAGGLLFAFMKSAGEMALTPVIPLIDLFPEPRSSQVSSEPAIEDDEYYL